MTAASSAQQAQPTCDDWPSIVGAVASQRNLAQELHAKAEARAARADRELAEARRALDEARERVKQIEADKPKAPEN
jgi:hypothetical protein